MRRLYETRPSPIEGNGCFASELIAAGTVVERFEGVEVTLADLHRIEAEGKYHSSLAIGEGRHLLMAVVDPREFADHLEVGSGVGGFNHSCDSNLWMQDAVTAVARRDIARGEELTLDEALISDDPSFTMGPCRCRAAVCRGTVTGADWRLRRVQELYEGHFSPFLNQRIAKLKTTHAHNESGMATSRSPLLERRPGGRA